MNFQPWINFAFFHWEINEMRKVYISSNLSLKSGFFRNKYQLGAIKAAMLQIWGKVQDNKQNLVKGPKIWFEETRKFEKLRFEIMRSFYRIWALNGPETGKFTRYWLIQGLIFSFLGKLLFRRLIFALKLLESCNFNFSFKEVW